MEEINYEIERQGTVKAPSTRAGHSTNTKPYVNQILVFILSHSLTSSHLSLSLSLASLGEKSPTDLHWKVRLPLLSSPLSDTSPSPLLTFLLLDGEKKLTLQENMIPLMSMSPLVPLMSTKVSLSLIRSKPILMATLVLLTTLMIRDLLMIGCSISKTLWCHVSQNQILFEFSSRT
jgi:hypothetical protein